MPEDEIFNEWKFSDINSLLYYFESEVICRQLLIRV